MKLVTMGCHNLGTVTAHRFRIQVIGIKYPNMLRHRYNPSD